MLQSTLFGGTRRETPKDEESKNAILLMRGGYISKVMSGVYAYLPLGHRVLQNVASIVRQEMNRLPGAQEVLMPSLHPKEIWEESGRWEDYKEDMYRLENDSMGLGPTHEEIGTDLFRQYVSSYKELPLAIYQIQTKFRRELRAKSGLLRGREFLMKDLYSFHVSEEDLAEFYEKVKEAYYRIFQRLELKAVLTEASGGLFSKYSHEFQVINPAGEDLVYLNAAGDYARNKEIVASEADPELLEFCGGTVTGQASIEVGNIFKLNRKFSTPLAAKVVTENGESIEVWTASYGIGISRLVGVLVEEYGDLKGKIIWPKEIAPFQVHLLDLTPDKQGLQLYNDLNSRGISILYDDRDKSAGEKFADADLVGSPERVIISKRSLEAGGLEVVQFATGERQVVSLADYLQSHQ
jgi:prolyl-tRNA synthetase